MGEYQGVGFGESINAPNDLFILNPLRQRIVTGNRNYTYLWKRFGCAGVLVTGMLIFLIGLGIPRVVTEVRLATMKTASTNAQVTDHHITYGKSTTYSIDFEFTVNGQNYDGGDTVSSTGYDQWFIGSDVQVTYAVDDPNTFHLGGPGIDWLSIIYLPIIIIIVLIVGLIWWRNSRSTRLKIQHLRRDGQLIFGQLKNSRGEYFTRGSGRNRHTDYDVTIYGQFTNPVGKKLDAHATFTRNDLKKKELQTTGSIAVLYVSDTDYMVL